MFIYFFHGASNNTLSLGITFVQYSKLISSRHIKYYLIYYISIIVEFPTPFKRKSLYEIKKDIFSEIRREVNKMRARIFDEARNMEASNSELVKQLEFARRLVDYTTPYIIVFEHVRWLVGIGEYID